MKHVLLSGLMDTRMAWMPLNPAYLDTEENLKPEQGHNTRFRIVVWPTHWGAIRTVLGVANPTNEERHPIADIGSRNDSVMPQIESRR